MIDEKRLIKFINDKDIEMSLKYMQCGIPYHQYDKDYGCLFREIKEVIRELKENEDD